MEICGSDYYVATEDMTGCCFYFFKKFLVFGGESKIGKLIYSVMVPDKGDGEERYKQYISQKDTLIQYVYIL